MRHREFFLGRRRGVPWAIVVATIVLGASPRLFASGERVAGQVVAGGGRSVATDRAIVGAFVLGPTGGSSDGTNRIDGGTIHYAHTLTATYVGNPVEIVNAQSRTVKIAVEGGTGLLTGRIFRRQGGQSTYTSETMSLGVADTLTHSLPASLFTIRGLEYYFEIERGAATILQGTAAAPFTFITRLNNEAGSILPDASYRMIGFPFDVSPASPSQVFEDDLGEYNSTEWRLGRYNPQSESYDEYPGVGTISRGRGYWLIARDGKRVGASGQSAVPDTTDTSSGLRYGRIILQPGWNQIATPYAFDIAWDDREAESGIESVLWAYTSGFDAVTSYDVTETLEPFTGYWLRNSESGPRQLLLPYAETAGGAKVQKIAGPDEQDWRINLSVKAGAVGDRHNVAGIAPESESGIDGNDYAEPPVIGTYVSLAFLSETELESNALLAGDFRPRAESLYTFEILIRGNVAQKARLTATFGSEWPRDTRAVLIDDKSNRKFDLRESPEIVLPQQLSEEGARYKLLVGDKNNAAFTDQTAVTIPRSFALAQNYPNPFNSGTTIGFDVSAAGTVRVSIFNVLGQAVRVLTDRVYAPGRYSVTWDGKDEHGSPVASGMYLYQLVSDDARITKQMVVLK